MHVLGVDLNWSTDILKSLELYPPAAQSSGTLDKSFNWAGWVTSDVRLVFPGLGEWVECETAHSYTPVSDPLPRMAILTDIMTNMINAVAQRVGCQKLMIWVVVFYLIKTKL